MTYWLRARQVRWLVVAVTLTLLVSAVVGGASVPMPNMLSAALSPVPVELLLPILPVIALMSGLANGDRVLETVGVRRIALLDTGLALVTASATALVLAAIDGLGLQPLGLAAARNVLGLTGVALAVRSAVGERVAALATMGFMILMTLFGHSVGQRPYWWAWILGVDDDRPAMLLALVTFSAGVLLALRMPRSAPRTVDED